MENHNQIQGEIHKSIDLIYNHMGDTIDKNLKLFNNEKYLNFVMHNKIFC